MIKLLASDLDGTIIDSNNKINSYDLLSFLIVESSLYIFKINN